MEPYGTKRNLFKSLMFQNSKTQAEPELISNPGMREPGVRLEVANGSRGHGLGEEEVRSPTTLRLIINPVS